MEAGRGDWGRGGRRPSKTDRDHPAPLLSSDRRRLIRGSGERAGPWLSRFNSSSPPGGCSRPSSSERTAVTVTLTLPVRWRGGGCEGSAYLPGTNAGSLGSVAGRSAYQRLIRAEEGQQVIGPIICQ